MNHAKHFNQVMSSEALIIAYDAVSERYPDRKMGNIIIKPLARFYAVMLYDLPKIEVEMIKENGVEVKVDRHSGKVIEMREFAEPSPYNVQYVRDDLISGKKAFVAGITALKGFENFNKEGKITVELVGDVYQVTFPSQQEEDAMLGVDYAFQVWVNSVTSEIVKILVPS